MNSPYRLNRWLGLIPLALFVIRLLDYVKWKTPEQMLWSCHLANLLLAVGLFFTFPLALRVGSLWAILGLLPWAIDMAATRIIWPVSWLSHLGGAGLGFWVFYQLRADRATWWQALLWFLGLQQVSRLTTKPELNVNVAHRAYGAAQSWFTSYGQYWLVNTLLAAVVLWLLNQALWLAFKPNTSAETFGHSRSRLRR
jgi:hypothetical protein